MPAGAVSTAIDPALVARFRAALERLNPGGGRIGLAVSGGPDSMAMLLLACEAIPGGFEVATVDHGLRPEAKDECVLVAAACEERGVACEVLRVEVSQGNVQAKAREARYDALGEWACRRKLVAVATAHHADDQAETLLMRLNRRSGLSGLAGVREAFHMSDYVAQIIRPLLAFRRGELASVIAGNGIAVAVDPSNSDDRFDRVRIRKALAEADWLDPLAIASSAHHLAEANAALDYEAERFWDRYAVREGATITLRLHPARAMRLRLIERACRELGGNPRGGDVARLESAVVAGGKANIAGVLAERVRSDEGSSLVFQPEPDRRTRR